VLENQHSSVSLLICLGKHDSVESIPSGDENPIRTLGDYSKPSHEGYRNTIELPVGTNVVPLRSDTIRLVQNGCSFHGLRSKDPNQHLKDFLKLVDSFDLDDENRERTRLHLFQFSLRDQASNWLERLPVGSITTWEDLTTRFLAWTRFKDLLQKFPHHDIDLWLQVQIFYDHVNPVTRRTVNQSAGGKLRDRNTKESWALLEDLALYDNESWNDPRDFAKPVKAIALPQDVLSTSDRRLVELENQVQHLMEAHLAPTQPTQVNKITTSCEICSGPHDTQYCMDDSKKAYVDYASSRANEMGGNMFTLNQGPRNFNDAANTWKEKPNFNWARSQTFTNLQNGSISDDMIGKINLLCKIVSKKLNDVSTFEKAGSSMAPKRIATISHVKKEELRKKGIKIPSKLFSPKYLSPTSIKELNENPSAPKRVYFVNSIVILSKDSDTEEDFSSTNVCRHDLGKREEMKK
nr:MAK10-like protein [Tanacetum cinerariifolium]